MTEPLYRYRLQVHPDKLQEAQKLFAGTDVQVEAEPFYSTTMWVLTDISEDSILDRVNLLMTEDGRE